MRKSFPWWQDDERSQNAYHTCSAKYRACSSFRPKANVLGIACQNKPGPLLRGIKFSRHFWNSMFFGWWRIIVGSLISVCLSFCPSINPAIYSSNYPFIYLFTYASIFLAISPFILPSKHPHSRESYLGQIASFTSLLTSSLSKNMFTCIQTHMKSDGHSDHLVL